MPTTISFLDMVETFKRAFHEVMAEYFDGNIHQIYNNPVQTFKIGESIRFVYDSRYVPDPPQGLTVSIIGTHSNWKTDAKVAHPEAKNNYDHGVELRAEVSRMVYVTSRIQEDDSAQGRQLVDQAWSQLLLVIGFARAEFSERGIYYPQLQPMPADIAPDQNFAQASGMLECQVRAQYARYNA